MIRPRHECRVCGKKMYTIEHTLLHFMITEKEAWKKSKEEYPSFTKAEIKYIARNLVITRLFALCFVWIPLYGMYYLTHPFYLLHEWIWEHI